MEGAAPERDPSAAGIWLYMPHAEYMFGRFGFDDAHTAARSFLFFSTNTVFTQTAFVGLGKSLRKEETPEERFQRRLQEGYDFSGIKELRQMIAPSGPSTISRAPPDAEYRGPYDPSCYVFREEDLNALRTYRKGSAPYQGSVDARIVAAFENRISEFASPLKSQLHELLNEVVLSYLDQFVVPVSSTGKAAAEVLFPKHSEGDIQCLDTHAYEYFTKPWEEPVPDFDAASVELRITDFLSSRLVDNPVSLDGGFIAGICRVLAYMMSETLELANNTARDSRRNKIVPHDVRLGVQFDRDLFQLFKYSRVFWQGR
ncbi:hypothetical protein ABW21_db0200489 [Orbilia brochopaga]|nr:hypothetical protein ABW21_db0200489 [Drechslerella brochopaga]